MRVNAPATSPTIWTATKLPTACILSYPNDAVGEGNSLVASPAQMKLQARRKGFTLGETLIALAIIGIVAALVMPGIVNFFKIKELESRFKRADAMILQAIQRTVVEAGYNDIKEFPVVANNMSDEEIQNTRDKLQELNEIWLNQFKISNYNTKWPNNFRYMWDGSQGMSPQGPRYILSNGMAISPIYQYDYKSIIFTFDTNGPNKGPNRIGWDIFIYQPTAGTNSQFTYCSPKIRHSGNGYGCYYHAHRNHNTADESKPYWDMLGKPVSYWDN